MARRSVLLIAAVLIALVGTALIVLYVQGIDERATEGQELVEVLTATDVIEAGESVTAAQEAGKFEQSQVRRDDMVEGAISSTNSITDLVSLGTIYPGEQLIAKKFGSMSDSQGLIIPAGKIAVSVELTDPERVAGFVNPGSDVAIFVSGTPTLTQPDGTARELPAYTGLLLPQVTVIGVGTTSVSARTTTTDTGEVAEQVARTILTLAVNQEEAEKLLYADQNSNISFALRSDDSKVARKAGVTGKDIMPEAFRVAGQ